MVSSPTVIIPCILIMIMMIYYLKTTNEGKTYALSELKNNLMSEREDFKKRMAQEDFQIKLVSSLSDWLSSFLTLRAPS